VPNALAYAAIFAWPLVAAAIFGKLGLRPALIWTILGGYLLLPEGTGVDLPMLPAFDKTLMPSLAAAALCLSAEKRERIAPQGWLPADPIPKALALLFLLGPFVTVALNGAPVAVGGGVFLRGLTLYDAFSAGLGHAVQLLPFLLGQRYLGDREGREALLRILALAGLAYSLPMLFEVRMSPQLHTWIYGFFQHSFAQMIREGGFRPIVFLQHGLWVAIFAAMATLAGVALWRTAPPRRRGVALAAACWLALALVFCRSLGALALAAVFAPVIAFLAPRRQVLIAAAAALVVILYPALRGAGLVPITAVTNLARLVNDERAASFQFRLDNEDRLLARANERPLFGWGGWGRSRLYDPATGRDLSVTDGRWIIVIGDYGWLGYIAEFGLLGGALILRAFGRRAAPDAVEAALAVILVVNLLDMLPNATLTPLTWLIAGALTGETLVSSRTDLPSSIRRTRLSI
jgi:hypothetical protein